MAVWAERDLVFRLQSPLHIGTGRVGNLMQTLPYVPARVVLGAWTAWSTRAIGLDVLGWQGYRLVGEVLNAMVRVSYLYPAIWDGNRLVVAFPWKDPEHYAFRFLGSTVRASLEPLSGVAAEGGLYEVEHLLPYTRDTGEPVFLVGKVWCRKLNKDKKDKAEWRGLLREIERKVLRAENRQEEVIHKLEEALGSANNLLHRVLERGKAWALGGERTYGWGRGFLRLEKNAVDFSPWSGWENMNVDHEKGPVLNLRKGERIFAHLLVKWVRSGDVEGPVEPLVRREWRRYAGSDVSFGGVAWVPGSVVARENLEVVIGPLGYWGVLDERCEEVREGNPAGE